jgi:hypothetical protein
MAEFAHHHDVQGPMQKARDFGSHDHAASRQTEHQIGFDPVLQQVLT